MAKTPTGQRKTGHLKENSSPAGGNKSASSPETEGQGATGYESEDQPAAGGNASDADTGLRRAYSNDVRAMAEADVEHPDEGIRQLGEMED